VASSTCDICGRRPALYVGWLIVKREGPRKGNRVRWHSCEVCKDKEDRLGGFVPHYEVIRR
jgi:hypothetical protein